VLATRQRHFVFAGGRGDPPLLHQLIAAHLQLLRVLADEDVIKPRQAKHEDDQPQR